MLKEATIHFCPFYENHFWNICTLKYVTIKCIEINWLCKHRQKVRGSQVSISIIYCTELSKTQFSLWVSLNNYILNAENLALTSHFYGEQLVFKRKSCYLTELMKVNTIHQTVNTGMHSVFKRLSFFVAKVDKIFKIFFQLKTWACFWFDWDTQDLF